MKKRLRKKLHREEYAEYGISLRASFIPQVNSTEFNQFIDEFIEHAIEANGLSFGGGGHPSTGWKGVIQPRSEESMISEVDLELILTWLRDRAEVGSFELSDSFDLWYGKNPYDN